MPISYKQVIEKIKAKRERIQADKLIAEAVKSLHNGLED